MKTIKTEKNQTIEIYEKDFSEQLNWHDANSYCNKLGNGWRLPTIEELKLMFINKDELKFAQYGYCCYWSEENINSESSIAFSGSECIGISELKNVKFYVRAVKTL